MALEPNTQYIVRVRHEGTNYGWTQWSESNTFTTVENSTEEEESDGA